ncbi:hypothetical protein BDD12DRAFT_127358 [Trichophaea hybrida]|nr:hypothetical protein BDD12DRAFT_127358 [Trichophaea hybrida]
MTTDVQLQHIPSTKGIRVHPWPHSNDYCTESSIPRSIKLYRRNTALRPDLFSGAATGGYGTGLGSFCYTIFARPAHGMPHPQPSDNTQTYAQGLKLLFHYQAALSHTIPSILQTPYVFSHPKFGSSGMDRNYFSTSHKRWLATQPPRYMFTRRGTGYYGMIPQRSCERVLRILEG